MTRAVMGIIAARRHNFQFLTPGPIDIPMKYKAGLLNKMVDLEARQPDPYDIMGLDLHTNAARGTGWNNAAEGFAIWHYPKSERAIQFGKILEAQLLAKTPIPSRGLKHAPWWNRKKSFYMLRKPACPMILLEMLFHTNEHEVKWINDFKNQLLMAEAIESAMDIYERIMK
jgi:hypothetical protein